VDENKPASAKVATEISTHGRKAQEKVANISKTVRPDLEKVCIVSFGNVLRQL
jgi:hypothetical protein